MDPSCVYALSAGFLAAAGSLCAKLSLGADYLRDMCESSLGGEASSMSPLRLLCGAVLLTCNTVMWTMFSKALRHGSSSAGATVTTTASNFIFSAILGRLIFGETHSSLWWMGMSLTLCGLLVLHGATPDKHPQEAEKKEN